jgi:prevent-host-death family protein
MSQADERSVYSPASDPRRIGVYDLRTHWFEYLRRARDGEVFIITRRGRPVARLEPLAPDHPARIAREAKRWAEEQGDAGRNPEAST